MVQLAGLHRVDAEQAEARTPDLDRVGIDDRCAAGDGSRVGGTGNKDAKKQERAMRGRYHGSWPRDRVAAESAALRYGSGSTAGRAHPTQAGDEGSPRPSFQRAPASSATAASRARSRASVPAATPARSAGSRENSGAGWGGNRAGVWLRPLGGRHRPGRRRVATVRTTPFADADGRSAARSGSTPRSSSRRPARASAQRNARSAAALSWDRTNHAVPRHCHAAATGSAMPRCGSPLLLLTDSFVCAASRTPTLS